MYFIPITEQQLNAIYKYDGVAREQMEKNIDILLEYINTNPQICNISDRNILRYIALRGKHSIERCKKILEFYFLAENLNPLVLQRRDPTTEEIKSNLSTLSTFPLPKITSDGNMIMLRRPGPSPNYNTFSVEHHFNWNTIMMDTHFKYGQLFSGSIIIFDLGGWNAGISKSFEITRRDYVYNKLFIKGLIRKIYVLQFDKSYMPILNFFKPFLKSKFWDRVVIWDKSDHELAEVIEKDCLPSEYGGDLDSWKVLQDQFYEFTCEHRDDFLSGKMSGIADIYLKTNSYNLTTDEDVQFGLHGYFRKLEID